MNAPAKVDVLVTQRQFDAIESAWSICAYGNSRRVLGAWAERFNAAVEHVLGYAPPAEFRLVVSEVRHG